MKFWRLTHPDYNSDYRKSYINGSLEHPFGLPGVKCEVCQETWSGIRILPLDCPDPLRNRKHLREGWPITLEQHKTLQREVTDELLKSGVTGIPLRPGDDFQPCLLDVPSRPRADFLWSSLGSVVVSQRVRHFFERLQISDVVFCPVTLRKIGKREAKLPALIPTTGEPEDIIKEVPLLSNTKEVGPYVEMVVMSESGYPPGGAPVSICSGCGRSSIDYERRRLVMAPEMWRGAHIFFLATTLHIIVTDDLKRGLQERRFSNINFISYETP